MCVVVGRTEIVIYVVNLRRKEWFGQRGYDWMPHGFAGLLSHDLVGVNWNLEVPWLALLQPANDFR